MSKRAFDKIKQGLEEARAYLDGTADKSRYRVHPPSQRKPTVEEMGSGLQNKPGVPELCSTTSKPGTLGKREPVGAKPSVVK
jgi:hypothetical protein